MLFQQGTNPDKLRIGLGHHTFERGPVGSGSDPCRFRNILWRPDTGHHILALRIDQKLAIKFLRPGRWIPRKRHAGCRRLAEIAEHHGLHIHGGSPACGNTMQLAIFVRPRIHPRAEHGANRAPELLCHILREGSSQFLLHNALVIRNNALPILGRKIGIKRKSFPVLQRLENILEMMMINTKHHIRIHLDEPAIGIPSKPRITRIPRQCRNGHIVQPEIQNRIHHARHRSPRARPDRDKQRFLRITKLLSRQRADMRQRRIDSSRQIGRISLAMIIKIGANFSGNRKSGRHWQSEIAHFSQIGPLATEQILHRSVAAGAAIPESVHPLSHQDLHFAVAR